MSGLSRRRLATIVVGLLLGNLVAEVARGTWNTAAGGANDWLPVAAAGRLLAHGSTCLYCGAKLAAAETSLLGRPVPWGLGTLLVGGANYQPFLNPPPAALVAVPLALLPPAIGFALFSGLSVAAIAVGYRVLTRFLHCPPLPTVLALLAVPGILGLALGQWAAILTLALVLALWKLEDRPVLAGLLLSLLLVKPQYVWLVPVALVLAGRWRVLLGLGIGAALLGATSVILVGPAGIGEWITASVTAGGQQMRLTFGVPGVVAGVLGPDAGYASLGLAAVLAVGMAVRWRQQLRARPELTIAVFACLSLLLSPHVLVQDGLVLAPALALAARRWPRPAAGAALLLSAIFLGDLSVGTLDAALGFVALAVPTMVALVSLLRPNATEPRRGPATVAQGALL
jgi:hypothetical protein